MLDSLTSQTPLPTPLPAGEELGPLVGRRIRGYELVGLLGEGPAGAVYRARNDAGKLAAIKVFHRELSRPPIIVALTDLFTRLGDLDSPDIILVGDSGITPDGSFFYISPLVEGVDLETFVTKQRPTAERAIKLGLQICHALGEAHRAGIVHGGLKPKNVFVSADGRTVWVVDFGVSRIAGSLDQGVILGDPSYMAPEQFGGRTDASSDVYAVGVLLYWLLSGELPFAGEGHGRIMMRQLSEKPLPPAGVESRVADVILRALSKEPEERYASLDQLGDALRGQERPVKGIKTTNLSMPVAAAAPAAPETKAEPAAPTEDLYPVGDERATEISFAATEEASFDAAPAAPGHTIPITKLEGVDVELPTRDTSRNAGSKMPPVPPKTNLSDGDKTSPSTAMPASSMEASLEDFISQANASFPSTDGWDLHTGDVELIDDDEDLDDLAPVAAPQPAPAKAARTPEAAAFKTPYGAAPAKAPRTAKPTPKGTKPMPTIEVKPGISVLPVVPSPAPEQRAKGNTPVPAASKPDSRLPTKPNRPTKLEVGVAKQPTPAAAAPTAEARATKSRKNPFAPLDEENEQPEVAAPKAPLAMSPSAKRRNPFDEIPDPIAAPAAVDEASDGFPKLERRKKSVAAAPERRREWVKNPFSRELNTDDEPALDTELSGPFQKGDPTETLSAVSRATAMAPAPMQNRWLMVGAIGGAFAVGALIVSVLFGGSKPKPKQEMAAAPAVAPAPAPAAPATPPVAAPAMNVAAAPVAAPATTVAAAAPVAAPAAAAPTAIKPVIPAPQPIVTALPPDPAASAPAPAPAKRHVVAHRAHAAAAPAAPRVAKAPKAAKPVAVAKNTKKSGKAQKSGDWVDPFSE